MSRNKTTEKVVTILAKRYPDMRFVDSDIKGLYYAVAPQDDRVAILCGGGIAVFTIEQLNAVTQEAIDIWKTIVDDGCKRKRSSQFSVR